MGNGWVGDVRSLVRPTAARAAPRSATPAAPVTRSKTKTKPCLVGWATTSCVRPCAGWSGAAGQWAGRSPTRRGARSGSATAACPCARRAPRGCWRTGCCRGGRRRRSRNARCRREQRRWRGPRRSSARSSCGRRRASSTHPSATCRCPIRRRGQGVEHPAERAGPDIVGVHVTWI